MINTKRIIAIIPARKNSKRLKNKNLLKINRKPLIYWSIQAALNSKYIDKVVLSTESKEIAKIGEKLGANVPFLRPKKFATDSSMTEDLIIFTLNKLNKKENYDIFILLQPTSPLRTSLSIDKSIEMLESKTGIYSVIGMVENDLKINWCKLINNSGFIENLVNTKLKNILKKNYKINGAIYTIYVKKFLKFKKFIVKNQSLPLIMNKRESIDIDYIEDFEYAKYLMEI